jgi:hypothetical protein
MDQQAHEGSRARLRESDLVWRELDGQAVLLDLESSAYFEANAVATVVLGALSEPKTRDELLAIVVEHFEVSAADADADLDDFLAHLEAHGLLLWDGPELPEG